MSDLALWQSVLRQEGFVLVMRDQLVPGFRDIANLYFTDHVLQVEHHNVEPKDRHRARDVVHFEWADSNPMLTENDDSGVVVAPGTPGNHLHGEVRHYNRVLTLGSKLFTQWLSTSLALVPPELRPHQGVVEINFFRTFTNVVTSPHQDGVEYVIIYVVDKIGEGGQTTLWSAADPETIILRRTLEPGDFLLFDDRRFLHDTSPLAGSSPKRDAVVCAIRHWSEP